MAEDMTEKILGIIVLVVVGIAVGMYVVNTFIVQGQQVQVVTNEQVTFTAFNTSDTLNNVRVIAGSFVIINATCNGDCATESAANNTMRQGTEYRVTTSPTLGYVTSINRTGTFNASYQYYPAQYVGGTGTTIINIVATIFALVIFVFITRKIFGNDVD